MNNKKRAFLVPVMTLAVCAIAMVGLGFAITSTVTTETNTAAELMIDLNEKNTYFDTETGLGHDKPGDDEVNSKLSINICNNKIEGDSQITVTGGYAFIKVYGNLASYTLKVEANPTTVSNITFQLYTYTTTDGAVTLTPYGSATLNQGKANFNVAPVCGNTYVVAITQIGTCSIEYAGTASGGEVTLSGTPTFDDNNTSGVSTVTGIKYTFTATNE